MFTSRKENHKYCGHAIQVKNLNRKKVRNENHPIFPWVFIKSVKTDFFRQGQIQSGFFFVSLSTMFRPAKPAFFRYNEHFLDSFLFIIYLELQMGVGIKTKSSLY